jgi:hypothetical protein
VSHNVINSLFTYNTATGGGGTGPTAGGNGGAIATDGNTYTVSICGTKMTNNTASDGGGAIAYISNDRSGFLVIKGSTLTANVSKNFETMPGIFVLANGPPMITDSTITK